MMKRWRLAADWPVKRDCSAASAVVPPLLPPCVLASARSWTDGAWWWTQDPFWARAGLWLAGVGAAGGWIASVAGLIDLLTVRRIRRLVTAWGHAIVAVMMLSLAIKILAV